MRPIPADDLEAHLKERIEQLGKSVLSDNEMSHEETQYMRGKYGCYREISNWIETNYS